MKILEIATESEQRFRKIYDAALKGGGMLLHTNVKRVIDSIKNLDESGEKKYIEFTAEIDRSLHSICDTALKTSGMDVLQDIQHMIESIKETEEK